MMRIKAINDESDVEDEDGNQVTKEAEETIAASEYLRALKFRKDNRIGDALSLLSELLETQVLFEVSKEDKKKPLHAVKYNCYKNIGLIHAEKGNENEAIEYLENAMQLDDSDVHTMSKLGQLALKSNRLDIAQTAFEKCLKKNTNHWPSGDGILQILCKREDYNEAYGWALVWYKKNNDYERGLNVILEVREKFEGCGLEYIENCWTNKFEHKNMQRKNTKSVFPDPSFEEMRPLEQPDIDKFKLNLLDDLNWYTFGKWLIDIYQHFQMKDDLGAVVYTFPFQALLVEQTTRAKVEFMEIVGNISDDNKDVSENVSIDDKSENVEINEKQENSDSNGENSKFVATNIDVQGNNSADASADDSDAKEINPSEQAAKAKHARRRGSDLKFLEQWCFWDRNRKYSQRQKNKMEKIEVDTTINGFLKKILASYFQENFDSESPFTCLEEVKMENVEHITVLDEETKEKQFLIKSEESFNNFIDEIKANGFCISDTIVRWLESISMYWQDNLPRNLLGNFITIYEFYLNHYDVNSWRLLGTAKYYSTFQITLFYLELKHERFLEGSNSYSKNQVNKEWYSLYRQLLFHAELFGYSEDEIKISQIQKRLIWLQFLLARFEYDLELAVSHLCYLQNLLQQHNENYLLLLPNQTKNNRIDLITITKLIVTLERTISLDSVQQKYKDKQFLELIDILCDSLKNTARLEEENEAVALKTSIQIETLLESFWNSGQYEDCMTWSERCLKFSLDCFFSISKHSSRHKEWAGCVSFVLTYIEELIQNESYNILNCLGRYYSRLIQSITRVVSNQLDSAADKNQNLIHPIDTKSPWIILHHVLQREEDLQAKTKRKEFVDSNGDTPIDDSESEVEETIPKSIMIFFTAHEYLGNRGWCTKDQGKLLLYALETCVPRIRAPYLEQFRDFLIEYLEQVTYCLYGYPAKRARLKHIEEHDAQNVELTWHNAMQVYDLYRPDELPEFNSYKNDSITSEMEQLLQKIIALIPTDIDPSTKCEDMERFIVGELNALPPSLNILPYQINSIFYLLADFYFKNRDFIRSVKYYILDLSNSSERFDSWAGLALSKASLLETKINSCAVFGTNEMIQQSEEVLRCFEQCLKIDNQIILLWIEYGNYAYALHSYCSRSLKQSSETLSMERFAFLEEKKEQCLKIAFNCFKTVDEAKLTGDDPDRDDESHDEKWLYHYMLGKIAEKRKESMNNVIEHYLKSAKYLYENNATYPFKISFTNPQNLSLEALEIFYRITAAIVKYVEQHSIITRSTGKYFIKVLKQLSRSPFAMNQAKINENSVNAFKRKLSLANEEAAKQKLAKLDDAIKQLPNRNGSTENKNFQIIDFNKNLPENNKMICEGTSKVTEFSEMVPLQNQTVTNMIADEIINSPLRRGSQESTATTTTTTTTGTDSTSTSSSDSSSTDTSSSDSDDSSSEDENKKDPNTPLSQASIETIYKMCIKNLEECITRFPEHYKSIYRLVLIYLNAPEPIKDVKKCQQLLMGTYTTALNNQIQGLFSDRKNNNLFNGIWRNPSSEIDRPGSFSAHLSKCVSILLQILRLNVDYKILLELILHLQRTPEADKRYIKERERKEHLDHAMSFCAQSFKELLKQHSVDKHNDVELLTLLIEIYQAHKKCAKQTSPKDSVFSSNLVETYKAYIHGKVERLPDTVNYIDLAVKLCLQEINIKKSMERGAKRLSLDDATVSSAIVSTPRINVSLPGISSQYLISNNSPSQNLIQKPNSITITPIPTPIASSIPTTSIPTTSIPTTSIIMPVIPGMPSRPRGRPPGSKNINHTNLVPTPNTSNTMNAMAGIFDNATLLMSLYSNPTFMQMLQQFTDPASLNNFLMEFIKLSKGNLTQFANSSKPPLLPPTTSSPSNASKITQPKPSITDRPLPTTSVVNAEQSSLSKLSANTSLQIIPTSSQTSIKATNTSISSSPSASSPSISANSTTFQSGSSTIISVGSGQLTITPTLSVSPTNAVSIVQANKSSTIQNIPKPKKSLEGKRKNIDAGTHLPTSKIYRENPSINFPKDLPKSLSIIPTLSTPTSKVLPSSIPQPSTSAQITKISKPSKPKKETILPNNLTIPSFQSLPFGQMPTGLSTKDLSNISLMNQYNELMRSSNNTSFMNNFEQFLNMVPPLNKKSAQPISLSAKQKVSPQKPIISNTNISSSSKGIISVKNLEALQDVKVPKTSRSKQNQGAKSPYAMPKSSMKTSAIGSQSLLNTFASSLQGLPNAQFIPSMRSTHVPSSSSSIQISPTKTLQQKLAEKQRAIKDANEPALDLSRPSSASSTSSSKTHKGDSEVIILE